MEYVYQCPDCKRIGRSPLKALVPMCTCGDGTMKMEYVDMGVDGLATATEIMRSKAQAAKYVVMATRDAKDTSIVVGGELTAGLTASEAASIGMYPATRDTFADLVDTSDAGRMEYIAHMISALESERDKPLSVVFSRWELGFIDSVARQFDSSGSLSEKQFQALMDLFYKKVA